MKIYPLLMLAILTLVCCNSSGLQSQGVTTTNSDSSKSGKLKEPEVQEMLLDTIYSNKAYKLQLKTLYPSIGGEKNKNTVLTIYSNINRKDTIVFQDTIFSEVQDVKFEDYNNDQVKDILVQNTSDVRSNRTYYLYLVDLRNDRVKKVKGFEEIKNPRYIAKYDLIDNLVMSGRNWTSFYKIQGDSVKDFDIVIYEVGNSKSYDKEYNKAISTILKEENNR